MEWSEVAELGPAQLVHLLDIEGPTEWSEGDTTGILRRQLAAPLLPDLLLVRGADHGRLEALVQQRPSGETFLQHLLSEKPSLELLSSIKALAHQIKDDVSNPLHGDPAGVIYFSAIASGLVRCRSRITSLTDMQLKEGFEWTLSQPAAGEMESLFRVGLERLRRH